MEIGYSSSTKLLMRYLSEEAKDEIDRYIEEHRNNESIDYNFKKDTDEFERNLTDDEYMTIRLYTGTNYKNINAVLRKTWNYEDNGDSSKKDYYQKLGEDISNIIDKYPELVKKFGIMSVPTLLFYKDGLIMQKEIGYRTPEEIKKIYNSIWPNI